VDDRTGAQDDEPEGGQGPALRARVAALGLDKRVRFLRAQPLRRLRLFYAAADATVMPSYYESFGMVSLEAIACDRRSPRRGSGG
jgi:D-inositol-3-phosphate glycosyltransferase